MSLLVVDRHATVSDLSTRVKLERRRRGRFSHRSVDDTEATARDRGVISAISSRARLSLRVRHLGAPLVGELGLARLPRCDRISHRVDLRLCDEVEPASFCDDLVECGRSERRERSCRSYNLSVVNLHRGDARLSSLVLVIRNLLLVREKSKSGTTYMSKSGTTYVESGVICVGGGKRGGGKRGGAKVAGQKCGGVIVEGQKWREV